MHGDDGHQTFQYNRTSSSRTSLGDDGGTYGDHPLIGEASVHTAFSSSSAGAGGAPPAECGRALFLLVVSLGRSWGGGSTPRRLAASCLLGSRATTTGWRHACWPRGWLAMVLARQRD